MGVISTVLMCHGDLLFEARLFRVIDWTVAVASGTAVNRVSSSLSEQQGPMHSVSFLWQVLYQTPFSICTPFRCRLLPMSSAVV